MPNDWFQFKQFKIEQDRCAMKVSTDACIQGAWAAQWLRVNKNPSSRINILDIGTGTGLLSLMIAQLHSQSVIDAVELNGDAFLQAAGNFSHSPWPERLRPFHDSLDTFFHTSVMAGERRLYDFIICNPPFFHNHLQAQQKARNDARHSLSLGKEELSDRVSRSLAPEGVCCVLYPCTEWQEWLRISAGNGLHPVLSLEVKPKATAAPNRMIGLFSRNRISDPVTEQLVIYEGDKQYTPEFRDLLQPYYLAL